VDNASDTEAAGKTLSKTAWSIMSKALSLATINEMFDTLTALRGEKDETKRSNQHPVSKNISS